MYPPLATQSADSVVFTWTQVSGVDYVCSVDGGAEFVCKCEYSLLGVVMAPTSTECVKVCTVVLRRFIRSQCVSQQPLSRRSHICC